MSNILLILFPIGTLKPKVNFTEGDQKDPLDAATQGLQETLFSVYSASQQEYHEVQTYVHRAHEYICTVIIKTIMTMYWICFYR